MATAQTATAFDPKPLRLGTVLDFTATTAVKAGQIVGINATGVGWAVDPVTGGTAATGPAPLGVALYSAAAGSKVAVAMYGSVIKVMNAFSDTTTIDAGEAVSAGATAGLAIAKPATDSFQLGYSLTDNTYNSTGYIIINGPIYMPTGE